MATTLQLIATRRRTLADQLEALTDAQWATQSLCDAWTVRDVAGHIVMPFTHSTPKVLLGILKARCSWDRFSERASRENGKRPTSELIALLRDNAENPWSPPGGGQIGALTDLTVHSLDITRPCGLDPDLDQQTALAVLDNLVSPKAAKAFGLNLEGLHLEATDADWQHGAGRPVRGTAIDLILAVSRRSGAMLEGEGSTTLAHSS